LYVPVKVVTFVAWRLTPWKYHASVLSPPESSNTHFGLYLKEKSVYEKLYHSGIDSKKIVPNYYGFLEDIDVRWWESELSELARYEHTLNAIFIEYIPGMQMLDIDTFSQERMERFIASLDIIHDAHILHGDPRPRNMMIVTAQGKSEGKSIERVLWLDFDHATTYCEALSEEEKAVLIQEALIIEQLGPLLVRSLFAPHSSPLFFLINIRSTTVLSVELRGRKYTSTPEY